MNIQHRTKEKLTAPCSSLRPNSHFNTNAVFIAAVGHIVGRILARCLCPLSADTASELDVLRHDGNALSVDGAQVRVFEQADLRIIKGRRGNRFGETLLKYRFQNSATCHISGASRAPGMNVERWGVNV